MNLGGMALAPFRTVHRIFDVQQPNKNTISAFYLSIENRSKPVFDIQSLDPFKFSRIICDNGISQRPCMCSYQSISISNSHVFAFQISNDISEMLCCVHIQVENPDTRKKSLNSHTILVRLAAFSDTIFQFSVCDYGDTDILSEMPS